MHELPNCARESTVKTKTGNPLLQEPARQKGPHFSATSDAACRGIIFPNTFR